MLSADLGGEKDPVPLIPVLVTNDRPFEDWLRPVAGSPLTFKTVGVGRPNDLTLVPFFRQHHCKGMVYFDLFTDSQWGRREGEFRAEQQRRRELEARSVDFFQPGEMQPERDHAFEGQNTRPVDRHGTSGREAFAGGWFASTLKVDPIRVQQVIVTYWGGDGQELEFDILADDVKIATVSLTAPSPNARVDVAYNLPIELTKGRTELHLKFQAHDKKMAGAIFGVRLVRNGSLFG